jgi:hypothetical protein
MSGSRTAKSGEWALIESYLRGRLPAPMGVLLRDVAADRLRVKLRNEWWTGASEDEIGIWDDLSQDFEEIAREVTSVQFLNWLETSASHVLRISPRAELKTEDFEATLDSLYQQHVCALEVQPKPVLEILSSNTPKIGFTNSIARAISRIKSASMLQDRWAYGAIAAASIVAILPWGTERFMPSTATLRHTNYESIVLPLALVSTTRTALPNLDAQLRPFQLAHRHPRKPLRALESHKLFHPVRLVPQFRAIAIAQIDAPPLQMVTAVAPAAASLSLALPEPPHFRTKRNRFVRLISALAAPFRAGTRIPESISESVPD